MLKNNFLVVFSTSFILSATPSLAEPFAAKNSPDPCPTVSYMLLPNGQCIDLSHLSGSSGSSPIQNSLVAKFQYALAKIQVPLVNGNADECSSKPGAVLLGFYLPKENRLVMCPAASKNQQQYINTLTHESWHVVQDCMDGIENSSVTALSEKYPEVFTQVLAGISLSDFQTTIALYPGEQQIGEMEARYMEDHSQTVLNGLQICASQK